MTNEEKAIELSNRFKCITIGERCKNIEDACYKMAKWKDEQSLIERKKLIDKACNWFTDHFEAYSVLFTTEQFIEDFKKAMEGGEQ